MEGGGKKAAVRMEKKKKTHFPGYQILILNIEPWRGNNVRKKDAGEEIK